MTAVAQGANYARVAQRWLLVCSEQGSHREQQRLSKNLLKDSTRELKAFAKLSARRFACEADAQAALSRFTASLMLLQLDAEVVGDPVYADPIMVKSQLAISFKSVGWRQLAWLTLKRFASRPVCSS